MSGIYKGVYPMISTEQKRFDALYEQHLRGLKLHGYSNSTIDVYSRAVRRLSDHYDCVPDQLSVEQLEVYFAALVDSHSWATVRVDRNGLQFFWKYVLKRNWDWLEIIKPPQVRTLPDVLTPREVEQLIGAARKLRYRVFILTTYSMGLRLSETLSLQVGDVDAARGHVHIRRGKGYKDRFVPLPNLTYSALRALWTRHRHPHLLFPNAVGSPERIRTATTHMDRGGTQKTMKVLLAECGIKKRFPFTPCATASPPICSNAA
jgi:integrase